MRHLTAPSLSVNTAGSVHRYIATLTDLHDWEPGAPPWCAAGHEIDQEVCREAKCFHCFLTGMLCLPYFRRRPKGYRVFALCSTCGSLEEF